MQDLVELINRDYADFVNLSANLVGLDRAIASIRDPLTKVREEIMVWKFCPLSSLFLRRPHSYVQAICWTECCAIESGN
jgi:hypothetical protein